MQQFLLRYLIGTLTYIEITLAEYINGFDPLKLGRCAFISAKTKFTIANNVHLTPLSQTNIGISEIPSYSNSLSRVGDILNMQT